MNGNRPKIKTSRLLLGMNSYMSSFSSPSMPHPNSFTRFRCCSFAISMISFHLLTHPEKTLKKKHKFCPLKQHLSIVKLNKEWFVYPYSGVGLIVGTEG
jgi:hypothetical protein